MSTLLSPHAYFCKFFWGLAVCLLGIPLVLSASPIPKGGLLLTKNQPLNITGTVSAQEDNIPLPGVAIIIKGSTDGTISDVNGNFTLEAKADDILIFSFTGYVSQEVPVDGRSVIQVAMSEDIRQMEEIVIVGYGTEKKSHLTGSISKVTNEQLDQIPLGRVDDALVGQIAGVNIQMTNPAAGEAPTIRVRGQGSVNFDSNPLIVVDGIAVGNDPDFLSSLDMNDVESIEVLKDAASSAIYGSRGSNGIIMITTKAGKEGPLRISYNSYVGFKSVPENDILTTVGDWTNFVRENNNGQLTSQLEYIQLLGTETDWEEVMMDGGIIQSHSLSARGGNKNTKFRASLSYLDDEGVLLTDNFQKINFRLNLDTKINDRISFGTVLNPSYTEQRRFPIGIHDALRQNPWLPLYLDENNIQFVNRFRENGRWEDAAIGDYAMERMFDDFDLENGVPSEGSGTDISATSNQSALAKVLERNRRRFQTKIFANAYLKIKLLKGLTFRQSFGGDARFTRNTNWTGTQATRNGAADSESFRSTQQRFHLVTESILSLKRKFGKHSLNGVAGFAYEKWDYENTEFEAAGFDSDNIQTIPAANLVGGFTIQEEEKLISYFSRVNYAFDEKYLLSLSVRWDGSSKFGPNNKFGFFPAASAGWRISEENFLRGNRLISDLKVRASYGETGNNGVGRYAHIGLVSPVGTAISGAPTGFATQNISNSDLKWEKLQEVNIGIDAGFLQGRFGFSFDYYVRTSKDLLLDLPIPSVTGFEEALVNRGEVENKGFELELRSTNYTSDNFTWSSSALFTHNKNTLVDFAGASGTISIVDDKRPAEWIALEGNPISSFYGYVVKEEIPLEFINDPFYPINAQSQDIYVKDLNGDGVIDTDDRTILGSPYPDLIWSFSNNFKYKNFDLTIMFQGSHGAEVRNISSQYINNEFASRQDYVSDFADADKVVQRIFTNDDVQDASYVALRNINLGYTLPANLIRGIRTMRIYVSGQNLLYFMADGYTGYNPEGIDQGLNNPLTYGYQRGPAPIYRTYSVGINLEF